MGACLVGTGLAYTCCIVTLVQGEWEPNALFRYLHLLACMQGFQDAVIRPHGVIVA